MLIKLGLAGSIKNVKKTNFGTTRVNDYTYKKRTLKKLDLFNPMLGARILAKLLTSSTNILAKSKRAKKLKLAISNTRGGGFIQTLPFEKVPRGPISILLVSLQERRCEIRTKSLSGRGYRRLR